MGTHRARVFAEVAEYGLRASAELSIVVLQPVFTMMLSKNKFYLISGESGTIIIRFNQEPDFFNPIFLKFDGTPATLS